MRTHTKETQATTTPRTALQFLREGNYRFMNNLKAHRDLLEQVNETRDGQFPIAAILSCIDSRTSAELIFDQGLGDIFSIRLAGNVVSEAVLGSMEFACKVAGSKLLVVLGHTRCGAIKGACDGVQLGNLTTLLNLIQPSVYMERSVTERRGSDNPEFVEKVARIHVRRSVETVVERSMVLREMIERGEVGLIGAVYDVETGAVEFLEDTFMLGEVKHFYLDVASAQRAG
ncbi:MAG TPA: carbonic anhydrase [Pyrinomonadaceae bacterium]|jgi:carbonic anhydrase